MKSLLLLAFCCTQAAAFVVPQSCLGRRNIKLAVSKDDLMGVKEMVDEILDETNWYVCGFLEQRLMLLHCFPLLRGLLSLV